MATTTSGKRKRSVPTGGIVGTCIDLTETDDEGGSKDECEILSVAPPKASLKSSKSSGGGSAAIPRGGLAAAANDGGSDSDGGECRLVSVITSAYASSISSSAHSARRSRSNSGGSSGCSSTVDFAAAAAIGGRATRDGTDNDAAYAAALQQDEQRQATHTKRSDDYDETYAAALQQDEECQTKQPKRSSDDTCNDEAFAKSIKQEEIQNLRETVRAEKEAMTLTTSGKAWLFVQRCLATHAKLKSTATYTEESASKIDAVAVDDMVYLTERLLDLQAVFRETGKPSHVDVGYHYTQSASMERIRTDGLMTHAERQSNNVNVNHNGSAFGDGIYTGNNPFAFRAFGEVGVLVARMQGGASRTSNQSMARMGRTDGMQGVDTVIGSKGMGTDYDEIVLRNSSQCVPIIRFASSLINPGNDRGLGNEAVNVYHREIQSIVDEFFNGGQRTEVTKVLPSTLGNPGFSSNLALQQGAGFGQPFNMMNAMPPPQMFPGMGQRLNGWSGTSANFSSRSRALPYNSDPREVLNYLSPFVLDEPTCAFQDLAVDVASSGECTICLDSLRPPTEAVSLKSCKHEYHLTCIKDALSHSNKCPVCRKTVGEVQGKSPSGTMSISRTPVECQGHEGCGSILITYDLPSNVQRIYHENPGQRYAGAMRTAYLPDSDEGKKLLERLKYAFTRGLTFVIGTSLTTGQKNCVTWSSIHHKTHPSGGLQAHGFPDDGYFANCNEELDGLGIPPAEDCKEKGVVEQTTMM